MDDKTSYDEIPVRLPSGTKAVVMLPRPFTIKDARHLVQFLSAYVEDKALSDTPPVPPRTFCSEEE